MTAGVPEWLRPLVERVADVSAESITRFAPPDEGGRPSAVLVLFGENAPTADGNGKVPGPDLLVLQRAAQMRKHAGQPAFPGGASDPEDTGPADTALREAREEVGLDPASVRVVATMPELWIPVTGFVVTPVLAWWHSPHPVRPMQTEEVARVERLPVAELVDPANRVRVRHPSGYIGPAFAVRDMLVWGFTAGVLTAILELAGWDQPWDPDRMVELPDEQLESIPPERLAALRRAQAADAGAQAAQSRAQAAHSRRAQGVDAGD
ncbi:MAG: NUDIX hydrolase [Micromonosporaceae bacterium]